MKTTVVRPVDAEFRSALRLAGGFAAATFLLHLITNLLQPRLGWGYFRDEFYYLACGRHLAWGYVDHGPLVALQARLAETLFGRSLAGLRMFTSFGAAARVLLTGLIAWALGGKRAAQALAMIAISVAPIYLAIDGFLSMNSCESMFWMTSLLALIRIEARPSDKDVSWLWLVFGVSSGLGLLNKPSMAFFLAAVLLALLVTPQRRVLASRWAGLGVVLMLLVALPNVLWQMQHHWATLEFLHQSQLVHASDRPKALGLIASQGMSLHPLGILVWLPGLVWLLRRPDLRWLGLTYLFFFLEMIVFHAKDYYPTPIYPLLFAAGGIAWESRLTVAQRLKVIGFPILESALLLTGLLLLPVTTPMLTPEAWVAYNQALHLRGATGDKDQPMPQFLADRFGWQEELDTVTRVVASLTPEDRAKVRILCSNYGEAGALEFMGNNLPPVISGHNNYWLWGPKGATGEVMIVINGYSVAEMKDAYADVERVGGMENRFAMPYEGTRNIYLARGRKPNLSDDWQDLKHFD